MQTKRSDRGARDEAAPSLVPVFINSSLLFAVVLVVLLFVFGVDAAPVILVVLVVVVAGAFGALMTVSAARSQRAIGGPAMAAGVQRALQMRALPYEADPAAWRSALGSYERRFRRNRWLLPAEFGAAALVTLWGSILSAHPTIAAGPLAVILLAIGLATSLYNAGLQRRTLTLIAELDGASAAG